MNRHKISIFSRRTNWVVWQIVMPLCFIAVSWPICKWIKGINYAFEKTFSGGDLLLFSALLLIGVYVELFQPIILNEEPQRYKNLFRVMTAILAFGVLMLFMHAVLKFDFIEYDFSKAGKTIDLKIRVFAYFSMVCTFFSVCLAIYGTWLSTEETLDI